MASAAITAGIKGVVSTINIVAALNHPYGECAPNAPDSESFIACWKHGQPDGFIPYFKGNPTAKQPGTKGWDFAVCKGATGGHAPQGGCPTGCDCSSANCVCAPAGAVRGNRDGSFSYANGVNAGPAQVSNASSGVSQVAEQATNTVSGAANSNKRALIAVAVLGLGAIAAFVAL